MKYVLRLKPKLFTIKDAVSIDDALTQAADELMVLASNLNAKDFVYIRETKTRACVPCHGTGTTFDLNALVECTDCDGTGQVEQ